MADLQAADRSGVARLASTLGTSNSSRRAQKTAHRSPAVDLLLLRGLRRSAGASSGQRTKENNRAPARRCSELSARDRPNDAGALAGEATTYLFDKALVGRNRVSTTTPKWSAWPVIHPPSRRRAWPYSTKGAFILTTVNRPAEAFAQPTPALAFNPNDALLHAARGLVEKFPRTFRPRNIRG